MSKATVTITINPAFTDAFVLPSQAYPLKLIFPYAMGATYDQSGRIDVKSPTGIGSSQPGPPPGVPYVNGSIGVFGPGSLKLTLVVNDIVSPTPNVYTVCGLLFNLVTGLETAAFRPAPGRDTFPSFTCNSDGSVDIDNTHTVLKTYNFLLLIQNYLGGMAIIDPLISNQ